MPFADTSVYKLPDELSDEQVLFLADILPTAFEVGVLNGGVAARRHGRDRRRRPDRARGDHDREAVHARPDRRDRPRRRPRREKALEFGADVAIDNGAEDAVERVMQLTGGLGADVAIEAVGVPETFELCTELVRPGGHVANVGVHGHPATLHLEKLWIRDVTIMTGLVDTFTTPRLLKLIANGRLDATPFATHRFPLGETMEAYDTFAAAADTNALKVVLEAEPVATELLAREGAAVGA